MVLITKPTILGAFTALRLLAPFQSRSNLSEQEDAYHRAVTGLRAHDAELGLPGTANVPTSQIQHPGDQHARASSSSQEFRTGSQPADSAYQNLSGQAGSVKEASSSGSIPQQGIQQVSSARRVVSNIGEQESAYRNAVAALREHDRQIGVIRDPSPTTSLPFDPHRPRRRQESENQSSETSVPFGDEPVGESFVNDAPPAESPTDGSTPSSIVLSVITSIAESISVTATSDSTSATQTMARAASSDDDCTVEPYDIPPLPVPALPSHNSVLFTIYRYRQQQGVNLGSWFLLESWMVPSLFRCAAAPAVSEHDVAAGWSGQARALLEKHWDTFITEDDFAWLASIGINTVRLPLGYWHIGPNEQKQNWMTGTLYEDVADVYAGAWPRVLRAINWAARYDIGVLIDLHGAPGSQNGMDHSGVSDGQANLFSSPDNQAKAIQVLTFLTRTFTSVPNVVGIQLLNEPVNDPRTFEFYSAALEAVRAVSQEAQKFPFYVHDAFNLNEAVGFMKGRGTEWNILDHHSYYVFTPEDRAKPAASHILDVTRNGAVGQQLLEAGKTLNGNFIVGEWSCALADTSLLGESDPDGARRQFCEIQSETYRDVGGGTHFWSYKKENCDQDPNWCFKNTVGNSLPGSFFSYYGLREANDLNTALAAAGIDPGSEGGQGRPSSPRIHPSTWAAVSIASIPTSTAELPSATLDASNADMAAGDFNEPSGSLTSLLPSETPATPTTEVVNADLPKRTGLPPFVKMLPDTVYASAQLPTLSDILGHVGQPDAEFPADSVDRQSMEGVETESSADTCISQDDQSGVTDAEQANVRGYKRWPANTGSGMHSIKLNARHRRQHRSIAIHNKRMAVASEGQDGSSVTSELAESSSTFSSSASPCSMTATQQVASQATSSLSPEILGTKNIFHDPKDRPSVSTTMLTPEQAAIQRGFSDGFMTAKMFAQQGPGMSRLGFKWQYVEDSLKVHGPTVIASGNEERYKEWFDRGLIQGETMVKQIIAKMNAK